MTRINCSAKDEWLKGVFPKAYGGFKSLVESVVQSILQMDKTERLGAEP